MEMVKVKYLRDIGRPQSMAGKEGDVKQVSIHDARQLINGGFAVEVTSKSKEANNDNK